MSFSALSLLPSLPESLEYSCGRQEYASGVSQEEQLVSVPLNTLEGEFWPAIQCTLWISNAQRLGTQHASAKYLAVAEIVQAWNAESKSW